MVAWRGDGIGSGYRSVRLMVFAREGRCGVGGTEDAVISLEEVEGNWKELCSSCGVEGAVVKGSGSASRMVGAVESVCFRGREDCLWTEWRDL